MTKYKTDKIFQTVNLLSYIDSSLSDPVYTKEAPYTLLSSQFPNCIQNDVTTQHLGWALGQEKPRLIGVGVGVVGDGQNFITDFENLVSRPVFHR